MSDGNDITSPQDATQLLHSLLRFAGESVFSFPETQMIRDLLSAGADINRVERGMTPLLTCLSWPYRGDMSDHRRAQIDTIAALLLEAQPNFTLTTPDGLDVFGLAEKWQDGGAMRNKLLCLMNKDTPEITPSQESLHIVTQQSHSIVSAAKQRSGRKFKI